MPERYLVAVPCRLTPGMFSSERVFTVTMADGTEHRGIASSDFCWNGQGKLVRPGEPTHEAPGMVAGKVVDELDHDQIAVELPDGEVVAIHRSQQRARPTPIKPPTFSTYGLPQMFCNTTGCGHMRSRGEFSIIASIGCSLFPALEAGTFPAGGRGEYG